MSSAKASERVLPGTLPDWLFVACGLSWGAALIHVSAALSHVHESGLYTLCFALLAPVQLGWGLLMCRLPSRRLLRAGCALSLLVGGVWAMSRTVGMPIGPEPWHPERVGLIDSLATADELTLVLLACSSGGWAVVGRVAARRGVGSVVAGGGAVGRGVLGDLRSGGGAVVRVAIQPVGVVLIGLSSLALLAAGHAG